MSNRQDDALPELPEPWDPGVAFLTPEGVFEMPVFTADQMRAYAQSAIASLQARLDAAEKDAARYRWLRDSPQEALGLREADTIYMQHRHGDELDAAVDKRRGAK